jgi:hypothetical protein
MNMMIEGVKNWCIVAFLYVMYTPCYVGGDKKETESAGRTQDRLLSDKLNG